MPDWRLGLLNSEPSAVRTSALTNMLQKCTRVRAGAARLGARLITWRPGASSAHIDPLWRAVPANLLKLDRAGYILDASDAWLEELEYQREQVVGQHHTVFRNDASRSDDTLFAACAENGRAVDLPCQLIGADRSTIDTLCTAVRMQDADSGHDIVLAYYRNIGERLRLARSLHDEHDFLMVTLHSIGDGVISTDELGRIRYLNPMAERIIGCRLEQVRERPFREVVSLVDQASGQPIADPIARCLSERLRFELPSGTALRNAGGRVIAIDDSVAPIINVDGQLRGAVMVIQDVSEARAAADRLRYLAHHDTLTRLPNRTALQERLHGLCARTPATQSPFALVFIDLDRFKEVNDTYGHDIGDRLLRTVSRRLTECLDPSDTVARIGGDEFVVVLESTDRLINLERSLQRLLDRAAMPIDLGGINIRITLSLGVARFPEDASDSTSLMQRADTAMYRAKRAGRNRHCFYGATRCADRDPYPLVRTTRVDPPDSGLPQSAIEPTPESSIAAPGTDPRPPSVEPQDATSSVLEASAA